MINLHISGLASFSVYLVKSGFFFFFLFYSILVFHIRRIRYISFFTCSTTAAMDGGKTVCNATNSTTTIIKYMYEKRTGINEITHICIQDTS